MAYTGPVSYHRDGLYFLHKEGYYALDHWPLAVLWKDAACSRYFVDTDTAGNALPQQVCLLPALASFACPAADGAISQPTGTLSQAVVLEYRMDRTVATGDDPPLVLACMPGSFVERMGLGLRPGKLLRFLIEEPGIQVRRPAALVRSEGLSPCAKRVTSAMASTAAGLTASSLPADREWEASGCSS